MTRSAKTGWRLSSWLWILVLGFVALVAVTLGGCGLLRGIGILDPLPPEKKADVLTDPFGYGLGLLRTVLEWTAIIGFVLLFPRPRAVLMPIISWIWTKDQLAPVADAVLAVPRAVGLVEASPQQKASMELARQRRREKRARGRM